MRVPTSDLNRHYFRKSRRIDCIETSADEITGTAAEYGISPRVLSSMIGDELVVKFEGSQLDHALDDDDTFVETIVIQAHEQNMVVDVYLRLITEELSCFFKVIVAD